MSSRITNALVADHHRIGELLRGAEDGSLDSYVGFRGALLRHIGIEEKIIIPELRAHGCEPSGIAQLRLDHSALVAMLVPSPIPEILSEIRGLLALHDPLEEGDGGIYRLADQRLSDVEAVLARIEGAPVPPLAPHFDGPRVLSAIETHLARARAGRVRV